jgi:hypothetical protein
MKKERTAGALRMGMHKGFEYQFRGIFWRHRSHLVNWEGRTLNIGSGDVVRGAHRCLRGSAEDV